MARVKGRWLTINVEKDSDVIDTVKKLIEENLYSHSISFSAPKNELHLYDKLIIRLDGRIIRSYVAKIERKKDAQFDLITCGELQTKYPFSKLI